MDSLNVPIDSQFHKDEHTGKSYLLRSRKIPVNLDIKGSLWGMYQREILLK